MFCLRLFLLESKDMQVDEVMPMPMQPQDEPCTHIVDELLVLCIYVIAHVKSSGNSRARGSQSYRL